MGAITAQPWQWCPGSQMRKEDRSCDCHVLKVCNVCLPYEDNKVCILKMKPVCWIPEKVVFVFFLGAIALFGSFFLSVKKNKSYPAPNLLASFLLEPAS